jgi:hypothetical protein
MPGDELERNGERFTVLSVAFLDWTVLVDGPRGQEYLDSRECRRIEKDGGQADA